MKRGLIFLIFPLLLVVLVACGSGSPTKPIGPALVMFYTDN
jgi:hypothetical protein